MSKPCLYLGYDIQWAGADHGVERWRVCLGGIAIRYGAEFPVDRVSIEEAKRFVDWMITDHTETVTQICHEEK